MASDTTPDSNEPDGRNEAPVWFLLLMLVIGIVGAFWMLLTFFNWSGF